MDKAKFRLKTNPNRHGPDPNPDPCDEVALATLSTSR